jgi:hypothetical protein
LNVVVVIQVWAKCGHGASGAVQAQDGIGGPATLAVPSLEVFATDVRLNGHGIGRFDVCRPIGKVHRVD